MNHTERLSVLPRLAVALVAALGFASSSVAQMYDAGVACAFPVQFDLGEGHSLNVREFVDRNGNPIRFMVTGALPTLTVTNLENNQSLTLKSKGQQQTFRANADGSTTYSISGNTVLTWFPTDDPPGPNTIAYVGHIVVNIDQNFVWTLVKSSGKELDLCALLE